MRKEIVLKDTWMPQTHTCHQRCPNRHTDGCMDIQMDVQTYRWMYWCTNMLTDKKPDTLPKNCNMSFLQDKMPNVMEWWNWKRGCGIPCNVPPCGSGIYITWQHLFLVIYIVQLYKEDCAILRYVELSAVALPSTEQIVYSFSFSEINIALNIYKHNFFTTNNNNYKYE